MRKRLTAILLILIFVLSLTGCAKDQKDSTSGANSDSGKKGKQIEMGRYTEQEIELPKLQAGERMIKILRNSQQQFEVYVQNASEGKNIRYIQQQDNSWKQDEPVWMNSAEIKQLMLNDICLGQDGRYYACFQKFSNFLKSIIVKVSENEKTCEIVKVPYFDEVVYTADGKKFYPTIQKMEVLKSGSFVLSDAWSNHSLIVISADGKKMDDIDTDQTRNYLVAGDNVYGINKQGKVFCYNTDTEKIDQTYDYDGNDSLKVYAVKVDGTLLMGDSDGIHRLIPNGTLWETTVDGASNAMSMPSLKMSALYVGGADSREECYIVYQDGEGAYQLKRYSFDQDVPAVPEKKITIYSLNENKTIRQAISLYQAKKADVKIDYVVAMGSEGGNVTDYIRALNTELLSGNGADVLILDGLPAASYIEKGVLSDISDIFAKPYADGTLLKNILEHYYKEGKTYYVPVRFGVPIRIGKKEVLAATEQFSGFAHYMNTAKQTYMPPTSFEGLIRDSLAQYYNDLCENGVLDQGKLKDFLEAMKALSDNTKSTVDLYHRMNYGDANGNHLVISNKDLFGNNWGFLETCDTITIQINNVFDTVMPNAIMLRNAMTFDTMGQRFLPKGMVGLNKASKEKDIAKDFISFLFTQEAQDTSLNDGFPTNTASLNKWFEEEMPGFGYSFGDDTKDITASWPIKQQRELFLNAIREANKPIEINQILYDMIIKSGVAYLSGEADIDETTSEIMSKVNTYLAE